MTADHKKPILLFILGCLIGCGTAKEALTAKNGRAAGAEEVAAELPSKERRGVSALNRTMLYLSSDQLLGRETGEEGIEKAALFIEDQLRVSRVPPYFSTYRDTLSNFRENAYNIVGIVEGNDPVLKNEYILLGAHYDHIGIRHGQGNDSIANGANDNASGTATVLELARYFGQKRTNGRSLIFALFSAEEKGLLGSKHLAKKLKDQELPLYLMLNFEMTGVPMEGKDYVMYVTGYNKSNLAAVSNRYAGEHLVGYLPTAQEFGLFERSDNFPFHQLFNVPSQTFCTFDFTNYDQYHKVGDELQRMDLVHMASLVRKIIPVIEGISNAAEKEIKYR